MQRLPWFLRVLSLWYPQFHLADIPLSSDVSQSPFYPADLTTAIIPGRSHSRNYTRLISQPPFYLADLTAAIIPGRSHSCHYTRPISQPPLYPTDLTAAIIPSRSRSRHYTRPISQPPLYTVDLIAAILPDRSHSRHSTRPISQPPFYPADLTTAILSVRRSTFSGYFTPDTFHRMGEESICGQRFTLHPNSFSIIARILPFTGSRPDSTIFRYSH